MTIGQTIAAERRKLGLSQEQLGEKMGVTRQSISKWESDAALPELADVMTQEVHAAAVRAELWQDGKKLADCLPVPAAEDLPLQEGGATAYSFQLLEIEVTMEADSWIGVVFIATDNLGRTSTNGEFFTLQDDMLIFTDDTDPIWEAIQSTQDSE